MVENNVAPDQMASSEASWSGSTVFSKTGKFVFGIPIIMSVSVVRSKNIAQVACILIISKMLTLNSPIATTVVLFSRLLKFLRSLYGK